MMARNLLAGSIAVASCDMRVAVSRTAAFRDELIAMITTTTASALLAGNAPVLALVLPLDRIASAELLLIKYAVCSEQKETYVTVLESSNPLRKRSVEEWLPFANIIDLL